LPGNVASTRIIRYGFYRTTAGKRRRYRCVGCGQTFSSTKGTPYYRLQHRRTTFDTVVTLRVEGVSLSAIARVERLAWNTVARWLERAASVCRRFSHGRTTGFVATELQADEIRSFTGGKSRPTWVFAAIEVWSRLWTSTVVGRRSYRNTLALVRDVASRMTFTTCPVIVTDGFEFYGPVIRRVFGHAALYAQVIKTRRHDRVVRVERRAVIGAAWRFDDALTRSEDSSTVNTSFIERLTIRQRSAYLARRTLSHARVQDTLDAHLELLRCYYNFVRPHGALKFGRETRTPAMQAGLATRQLTLRDIFVSLQRVVWWLSDGRVCADLRRTAAAAVMYMPVAA
jgi:transposase-like protein/IS1 family transposase